MTYSFEEAQRQAEAEYGFSIGKSSDSEWLTKFPLGDTRFRLLTPLYACPQHYKEGWDKNGICIGKDNGCPGCEAEIKPSMKWLGLVYHEEKIKPALLPHKVFSQLGEYQKDPEYAFDFPMPYDVIVTKKSTGALPQNVEYIIRMGRTETALPENVLADLEKHNTPEEIKESMKKKQIAKVGTTNPEDYDDPDAS